MLELHRRWDEHYCMCKGENSFPWKLAKGGQGRHALALLIPSMLTDHNMKMEPISPSLSVFLLFLSTSYFPILPFLLTFLFIFLSNTFRALLFKV